MIMSKLDDRLQANVACVHERISAAARAAGRDPRSIVLLAVSKTFGIDHLTAALRARLRAFGENYAQEGADKIARLRDAAPDARVEWHFVGPIQSNKTRLLAESFDWVHTVERLKIAQRLSEQRPANAAPLNVLLQVNISGEGSKSGVAPGELPALARDVAALPRLRLRGLMAIPAAEKDPTRQRAPFARLRGLLEQLNETGLALDTLSMGMSADLEAAILEGATIVRVGTAIFGERN